MVITLGAKKVYTNHDCCWDKFTMIMLGTKAVASPTPGRVACEHTLRGAPALERPRRASSQATDRAVTPQEQTPF